MPPSLQAGRQAAQSKQVTASARHVATRQATGGGRGRGGWGGGAGTRRPMNGSCRARSQAGGRPGGPVGPPARRLEPGIRWSAPCGLHPVLRSLPASPSTHNRDCACVCKPCPLPETTTHPRTLLGPCHMNGTRYCSCGDGAWPSDTAGPAAARRRRSSCNRKTAVRRFAPASPWKGPWKGMAATDRCCRQRQRQGCHSQLRQEWRQRSGSGQLQPTRRATQP